MSAADMILAETADLRSELLQHPIYTRICDVPSLQIFMQHHVFAVLDFMWLLKRLQKELTCTEIPWLPVRDSDLTRFVNEIVLGEESDEDGQGGYCSHFELYQKSMKDVHADRESMNRFTQSLRSGVSVTDALATANTPISVQNFVGFTHHVATTCSAAEVACVFCFGREDIIPDMFQRLLTSSEQAHMQVPSLSYYIRRHIELDGDHHGPLARRMVNLLCGDSDTTELCIQTTRTAIQQRIYLWDGVLAEANFVLR
ncbi:MAG: DUF3050 domain-containing protein [Planctomycetaceae bacterium]